MGDPSRIGEARRHGTRLAHELGLDETETGRLALVVTELSTNLLRHAFDGRLLIAARPERRDVELIAIDRGPGIADLGRCLGDGYSTGGTPGTGLGAIRRLASDFDVHTAMGQGTIVLARIRAKAAPACPPHGICGAAISLRAPGENVCGDVWAMAFDGARASVLVADGLGHGPAASDAARAALGVYVRQPFRSPREFILEAHAALRGTRGAAVAMLLLDSSSNELRCAGAGNILGRLVSGSTERAIATQHGTLGLTLRTPDEPVLAWPMHALLLLHSDGVESRWQTERVVSAMRMDPAIPAAMLIRDHCRGRDDATVAVLRRKD